MTIDEHFRVQAAVFKLVLWVGTVVTMFWVFKHQQASGFVERYGVAAIAAAATLGVLLVIQARSRCPRCGGDLRKAASAIARGQKVASCPHCGVSFNDPWP